MSLRARGSASSACPRFPGRYRTCRVSAHYGKGGNVEEVTDEPLYRDRVCGIDIGKAEMYATVRVPSEANQAGGAGAGGLAAVLAGPVRGDGGDRGNPGS